MSKVHTTMQRWSLLVIVQQQQNFSFSISRGVARKLLWGTGSAMSVGMLVDSYPSKNVDFGLSSKYLFLWKIPKEKNDYASMSAG